MAAARGHIEVPDHQHALPLPLRRLALLNHLVQPRRDSEKSTSALARLRRRWQIASYDAEGPHARRLACDRYNPIVLLRQRGPDVAVQNDGHDTSVYLLPRLRPIGSQMHIAFTRDAHHVRRVLRKNHLDERPQLVQPPNLDLNQHQNVYSTS